MAIRAQSTTSVSSIPDAAAAALALLLLFATTILGVPQAHAQTFTVLHTFTGAPDGALPEAGVTMDAAGNLYGTTFHGGTNGVGLVYKLTHKRSGWVLSPLYSFQGGQDGYFPAAGVTIGRDGNLYGTTEVGGTAGDGTVYAVKPQ